MDIKIPHLGEGTDTGTVVNILVREGDTVVKEQTVLELENEKAVAPIPASEAGVVSKILIKVGDKVSVGQPVIRLGSSAGAPSAPTTPTAVASTPASASVAAPIRPVVSAPAVDGAYYYQSPTGSEPPASPSVRKMAMDLGLDLRRIKGSEAGGRVTLSDLRNYIQTLMAQALSGGSSAPVVSSAASAVAAMPIPDFSKWGPVTKKPASSLRQKIAEKMSQSWTTVPHVTQFDEVDITDLMTLRKKYAATYEKKGAKLTMTSFAVSACVSALKKMPIFNTSYDTSAQQIVYKQYYHIGIAVDTEQGLIVPVIKDADKKSIFELSKATDELAEKTRSRKIGADDLKGGTFTISNLGSIGGTHFTPIVNTPEVAILGIGKATLKPRVDSASKKTEKVNFIPRLIMPIAISYDHRVIDGADAARFIREIATALESLSEKEIKI